MLVEEVSRWDFQNNAARTSSPGPAFVLEVPLPNLLTSICNFVAELRRPKGPPSGAEPHTHIGKKRKPMS